MKFRYVFKNLFGDVSVYYFTLQEIEDGTVIKILNSGMRNNGYRIVARDFFIGLNGKNLKEIYENDIIENSVHERELVVFENGECSGQRFSMKPIFEYWNVVGNIHENPELLANGVNETTD